MTILEHRKNTTEVKEMTLGFLVKDNKVLLAMKKRGFGVGRWNGIGGKLEVNESPESAMKREANEEINIKIQSFRTAGSIIFYDSGNVDYKKKALKVYLYIIDKWDGIPKESEEMRPQWFDIKELPFRDMWNDDRYWLETVLSGKSITSEFLIDEANNKILEYVIDVKRQI